MSHSLFFLKLILSLNVYSVLWVIPNALAASSVVLHLLRASNITLSLISNIVSVIILDLRAKKTPRQ